MGRFKTDEAVPTYEAKSTSEISLEYFVANNLEIRAMGKGLPDLFKSWVRRTCPKHLGKGKAEGDWLKLYEKFINS